MFLCSGPRNGGGKTLTETLLGLLVLGQDWVWGTFTLDQRQSMTIIRFNTQGPAGIRESPSTGGGSTILMKNRIIWCVDNVIGFSL